MEQVLENPEVLMWEKIAEATFGLAILGFLFFVFVFLVLGGPDFQTPEGHNQDLLHSWRISSNPEERAVGRAFTRSGLKELGNFEAGCYYDYCSDLLWWGWNF